MTDKIEKETEDKTIDPKAVCICNEAFRVGECPVHPSEKVSDYPTPPTPEVVMVTAADRYEPTKKTMWVGFGFTCPKCKENSLRHWETGGYSYCPCCGTKVEYSFSTSD